MFVRKLLSRNNPEETEDSSNKWQRKLHLAQISPEPVLDLTDCAIKCLPKGVYSQCRIFRKNRLLLSNNCLSSLPDDRDNRLNDLNYVCNFLDLSRNQLKLLPSNLGNIKELYLSHNQIKCIPESFVSMKSLEIIDISHNQFNQFPRVLCFITSLKLIDISYNQLITRIPSNICNLIKLKKLVTIGTKINHPPKRICDEGIESLYKFFKHDQLINNGMEICENFSTNQVPFTKEPSNEDNLQSYLTKKDDRKRRLIEFEKSLLDENKLSEATNRKMIDKRQEMLIKMKQDQLTLHKGLESLFAKKDEDKSNLIRALSLIEEHSSQLANRLKDFHSRIKRQSSNESIIYNGDQFIDTLENKLRQLIIAKDLTKESLQSELIKEDESLHQAICNFVDMKNTQSRILSEQIGLIQNELYHLTRAEIQWRSNKVDRQMTKINGQRVALASLLKDLLDERNSQLNQQENESSNLSNLISEVTKRENDEKSENIDPHHNQLLDDLDPSLSQLPLLANCSMSFQQLADPSNDQLKPFGIKEQHIPMIQEYSELCFPMEQDSPSAPRLDEISLKPSAPPMKLYQLIECVICLDEQSKIILIPCGHCCTCVDCSKPLGLCPLCRSEISEKIKSN